MLGNPRALPLLDDTGDVVADVVLQSVTLLLGDHLALGLGLVGADLLRDGGALLLKPGGVLLILCSGALLLVNSSLNSPRHIHTALLWDAVTLFLEQLLTLLLHIAGGLTMPLELGQWCS